MTSRPAGFTLVEVATTVCIMSILAVVALPPMATFLDHQRTAAAASSLVSHMSHARLAAVKHRHPAVLCPSLDGLECAGGRDWTLGWIMFIDRDGTRRPSSAADLLQVEAAPRSRHLRLLSSSGRNHLRYMPDGRSAGSNLTIRICSKRGLQLGTVVVNNAGRPRTELGSGGTPCPG